MSKPVNDVRSTSFDARYGTWTPVNDVTGHDGWTRDAAGQQYVVLSQHSKYSLASALERGIFYSIPPTEENLRRPALLARQAE